VEVLPVGSPPPQKFPLFSSEIPRRNSSHKSFLTGNFSTLIFRPAEVFDLGISRKTKHYGKEHNRECLWKGCVCYRKIISKGQKDKNVFKGLFFVFIGEQN